MMNDGNEIVTTLTKLFWATDHHDWEGLRRTFAGQVLLDYTALNQIGRASCRERV